MRLMIVVSCFGASSGRLEAVFGNLGTVFGHLDMSWADLGLYKGCLGGILGLLGDVSGPSWGRLGTEELRRSCGGAAE